MSQPKVSVIIVTYNRAQFLVEAIRSVLAQSLQDFEIIVADDGSTYDTTAQLAAFGDRVQYLRLEHRRMPEACRNRAIAMARGELIAFLDDDDIWAPTYLERQTALFDRDPALGFTYCDVRFLYADGSISDPRMLPQHKRADKVFDHLLNGWFIQPSTQIIRRVWIDRLGPIDEDISSQGDAAFLLRLAYSAKAACTDEPLVFIRRHPQNLSQQREIEDVQNVIRIYERLLKRFALSLRRQLRLRLTLSHLYAHVGLAQLRERNIRDARRFLAHSLRYNPLQRHAWIAFAQSLTTLQR